MVNGFFTCNLVTLLPFNAVTLSPPEETPSEITRYKLTLPKAIERSTDKY
jgi:hypothetical protein